MPLFGIEVIPLLDTNDTSLVAVNDISLCCRIAEESNVNINETNVE